MVYNLGLFLGRPRFLLFFFFGTHRGLQFSTPLCFCFFILPLGSPFSSPPPYKPGVSDTIFNELPTPAGDEFLGSSGCLLFVPLGFP